MPSVKYTYSIENDTLNGVLNSDHLTDEIQDSSIITALDYIDSSTDVLDIWFKDTLSAGDETSLDTLVSNHDGAVPIDPIQEVIIDSSPAFAAKTLSNGKKLYARVHGETFSLSSGSNTCSFSIPYPEAKITGLELIGGELGDKVDLTVHDDALGTYTTVANYQLNQFGYDVYLTKDYYRRESNYDADLYEDMVVKVTYESVSAKDIYINYLIHEVKD